MTDSILSTSPASETGSCPLRISWCQWSLYAIANGRHFTSDEKSAILRARRRPVVWRPVAEVPVAWSIGPGATTVLADGEGLLRERRHRHASIAVGQRSAHIDWVCGTGGGPGFSYSLVRIYVDDELVDEQVHGGSALGFTVWGGTALGPVRRRLAVGVERRRFSDAEPPIVWLMGPDRGVTGETLGNGHEVSDAEG